jgi:hypothetical protein
MKMKFLAGMSMLAILILATPAFAGFATSVTGNGALIAPPPSALPGAIASDGYSVWNETQGTLAAPVSLDYNGAPGSYNGLSAFTPTVLAPGTKYGTTMVHFDPVTDVVVGATAVITFSHSILGIALRGTSLDATDIYGAPGTTYATGFTQPFPDTRGIDFRTNDRFTVSADGKTLQVRLTANFTGFDEMRVFTSGVPEPASLVVWSLMGAVVAGGSWWRRQRPAV